MKKHGYTLKAVLETIMRTLFSQEEVMKRYDISLVNNKTVEYIKNLMKNLNWTAEQAMDALKIPEKNRKWLLYLMSQPEQDEGED